jgi:dolichyl-phosphate beta-glucosyltransferase
MNISVIIPAYNEEQRIAPTLERVSGYLGNRGLDYEILVVDDGSTDGTPAVVRAWSGKEPALRLLTNGVNMGKGASVRNGILASAGEQCLISDADLSTPIEEMEKLRDALDEGCDVAIGSRGLKEAEITVRQPWYRKYMGKSFNLLVKLLLFRGIEDTQCGFKLFRADAARNIFSRCRISGFSFDGQVEEFPGLEGADSPGPGPHVSRTGENPPELAFRALPGLASSRGGTTPAVLSAGLAVAGYLQRVGYALESILTA